MTPGKPKLTVEHHFFCLFLRCDCAFRVCLERQLQRAKVHRSGGLRARFTPCGTGGCVHGMDNRMLFPRYQTKKRPVSTWGHEARGGAG